MAEIVLLDGGMGQELVARNTAPPKPLWSAQVLDDAPELVEAVHRDFAAAGATLHTLNTYSVTPERLARHLPADRVDATFARLQAEARARLAAAIGKTGGAVAGCLPPLAGSYHPETAPDPAEMDATYARLVAEQGPHCDVLLAETMSSVREARSACAATVAVGHRAWIALSVDDADGTRLRSGEALADGVAAVVAAGGEAVLLNCSRPEVITQGLPLLAQSRLRFGAYANGFEHAAELPIGGTVAGMARRTDLGPEAYADHAMAWVDGGATIVGGCCEVSPAHIAHLADRLRSAGHTLVRP